VANDNTLRREGLSRLIDANHDLELMGVATDPPQLLALIATKVHDALRVAGELAAEGFFGHVGAKDAVAWDGMLAGFEEPHVTIATASLVLQR
jgi:hypothetical protein